MSLVKTKTAAEIAEDVRNNAKKSAPVTTFVGMKSAQIYDFLDKNYGLQFHQLLPNKVKVEKFIAQSIIVISQNDNLKSCTLKSMLGALSKGAGFGFNPLPELGQCWFIPYMNSRQDAQGNWIKEKECQFQIGGKGYVKLLNNTGLVKRIKNKAVHVEDVFREVCGTNDEIIHEPCTKQVTWETLHAAYAIIELFVVDSKGNIRTNQSGEPIIETHSLVMYKEEIDRIRKKGVKTADKTKLQGGWVDDAGEMAKLKVLKKLIKDELPISDELIDSLAADEQVYDITQANMAKKELLPVPVEESEPENVEVLEVVETQKTVENAWDGNNVAFDNIWTAIVKGEIKPEEIEYSTIDVISEKIKSGVIPYTDVPNELLSIKDIENAVFSMEQKTAIK